MHRTGSTNVINDVKKMKIRCYNGQIKESLLLFLAFRVESRMLLSTLMTRPTTEGVEKMTNPHI